MGLFGPRMVANHAGSFVLCTQPGNRGGGGELTVMVLHDVSLEFVVVHCSEGRRGVLSFEASTMVLTRNALRALDSLAAWVVCSRDCTRYG